MHQARGLRQFELRTAGTQLFAKTRQARHRDAALLEVERQFIDQVNQPLRMAAPALRRWREAEHTALQFMQVAYCITELHP